MGSDSGFGSYTLTFSLGVQPQSPSHGPLMTLMLDVPVESGAERSGGRTVHGRPKPQNPTEKKSQEAIQGSYRVYKYTDSEGGAVVQGGLSPFQDTD